VKTDAVTVMAPRANDMRVGAAEFHKQANVRAAPPKSTHPVRCRRRDYYAEDIDKRRLRGVVSGVVGVGVGVVGLVDGRRPAGEQVQSIVRRRSGLGAVGGKGQASVGWEFHGLVFEAEFADDGVVVSLESGSEEAHVVGGPPLAEGFTAGGEFPDEVGQVAVERVSTGLGAQEVHC
jgi:hypothetical protein